MISHSIFPPEGADSATRVSLRELIAFARQNSPYYKTHYSNLPKDISDLNPLPIVDHTTFWSANRGGLSNSQVLTSAFIDGAIFRTGGTTATPKTSYVTRDELRQGARTWGQFLVRHGLRAGDRVANLLYGGDLYKGFLDLSLALMEVAVPNVHLTIGVAPLESQAWTLREHCPTVVVAMPTIMCRLAEYLIAQNEAVTGIRMLLYLGEMLHQEQKVLLRNAFPGSHIAPLFYGSVDGGFIGVSAATLSHADDDGPLVYTVCDNMIMELFTDTEEIITTEGQQGRVVITNLSRRLMPIIRYPMGDEAQWVDYSARTFRLCGWASVGVRVGPYSYHMTDLRSVVSNVLKSHVYGFQVVVRRKNGKDELMFRIASRPLGEDEVADRLRQEMDRVNHEWADEVWEGLIHPLCVEWVSIQDLHHSPRSGKLTEIVDLRCEG